MKKKIIKALREVFDPELGINIIDMGLIYNIKVREGAVAILMTLTSPMCPYGALLKNSVRKAAKIEGIKSVIVKLTMTPVWDSSKMSKEAVLQLAGS